MILHLVKGPISDGSLLSIFDFVDDVSTVCSAILTSLYWDQQANAEKNKMAEKVKIVTDELMALREEKAKMEACFEENAKSKQEIDTLTSKIATLLSSNEQAKAELEKVISICRHS